MQHRFYLATQPDFSDQVEVYEPKGWKDITLTLKRDKDLEGVFFSNSSAFTFTSLSSGTLANAYSYIKGVYDAFGIFQNIYIAVHVIYDGTDYEVIRGKLNLQSLEFDEWKGFAKCNIDPEGRIFELKSKWDTKVNLLSSMSLDGTTRLNNDNKNAGHEVTFGGMNDVLSCRFEADAGINVISNPLGLVIQSVPLPLSFNQDNTTEGNNTYPVSQTVTGAPPVFIPLLTAGSAGKIRIVIKLSIKLTFLGSPPFPEWAVIGGTAPAASDLFIQNFNSNTACFEFETVYFSFSPAQAIYLNFAQTTFPASVIQQVTFCGTVHLYRVTEESDATVSRAFLIYEAFHRIIESLTNDQTKFVSDAFARNTSDYLNPETGLEYPANGCLFPYVICNGTLLRNFKYQNQCDCDDLPVAQEFQFPVSIKAMFDGLNPIFCLGAGMYENGGTLYFRVEPKRYFYADGIIFSFDNVPKIMRKVDDSLFYANVKVGYQDYDQTLLNGLDEINSIRELTVIENKTTDATLDLTSEFVASSYAIEFTKQKQFDQFPLETTEFDDATFVINVRKDDVSTAEQGCDLPLNMVQPENLFNVRISPMRNLRRWREWLSAMAKNGFLNLKFVSGEANYQAVCQPLSYSPFLCEAESFGLVEESGSLILPGFSRFFEPEIVEFEYPLNFLDWLDIQASPTLLIRFRRFSTDPWQYGWLLEVNYRLNAGIAKFKLRPKFIPNT